MGDSAGPMAVRCVAVYRTRTNAAKTVATADNAVHIGGSSLRIAYLRAR